MVLTRVFDNYLPLGYNCAYRRKRPGMLSLLDLEELDGKVNHAICRQPAMLLEFEDDYESNSRKRKHKSGEVSSYEPIMKRKSNWSPRTTSCEYYWIDPIANN
ncbi:hypothetical protein CDAR_235271 [Caerostris darwini]|uniref:Uncharacterized protein n=1 Tax=Caerostris darwini TaxID=1538125 RepID=A0AAV4MU70_9ARAC|nr:hypothetical protein CDAR_235271 [Caerostris darwini]